MKILIIHNHYQQAGGEQVVVDAQIKLLREQGHSVIYYSRDNDEISGYNLIKKAVFPFQTIYSPRTERKIRSLIRQHKPDIAHIHNVFPLISPSVYRVLSQLNVPIVQTVHNFRFMCPNGLFYTHGQVCEQCKMGNMLPAVIRQCYRDSRLLSGVYALSIGLHRRMGTFNKIDRFITLNRFTSQKLVESGVTQPHKISHIPNFIYSELCSAEIPDHKRDAVFMGRLSAEKGVKTLIESLEFLPDLCLHILGSGPLESALRNRSVRFNNRVIFEGFLEGEQKQSMLRNALFIVVPSVWYEQFPVTVLESMAAGTAVIASNLGGLPEIVRDGENGLLFEAGNSRDLAEKMKKLIDNPELAIRLGQTGQRMAAQNYSSSAHAANLLSVYQSMLAEKRIFQ